MHIPLNESNSKQLKECVEKVNSGQHQAGFCGAHFVIRLNVKLNIGCDIQTTLVDHVDRPSGHCAVSLPVFGFFDDCIPKSRLATHFYLLKLTKAIENLQLEESKVQDELALQRKSIEGLQTQKREIEE